MRDFKVYIYIALTMLLVYVVVLYNKPAPINWQPTLNYNDKIPFGTYVSYHQLQDIFPGAQVTNTSQSIYSLLSKQLPSGNYIIVSKEVKIDKVDLDQLKKYIKSGNTVFITAFSWAGIFKDSLKLQTEEEEKDKTQQNFTNSKLKQPKNYTFDKDVSNQYFSSFDTAKAMVITKNNNGNATCISYHYGKGSMILCANPELFSNYNLLKPQGAEFVERMLSYLPAKKNIYWDEYQNHDIDIDNSPMRVFLNNPPLQYAYYLSLFALLIFIIFEAKRRQRIIPVIEPLKNTTVDFVNVVGRVYYENHDNANIALKKIVYLLGYLREKYRLKTDTLDTDFTNNLANKTGIEPEFATQLVNQLNYLGQQPRVTDHELIVLNKLIEKFYELS